MRDLLWGEQFVVDTDQFVALEKYGQVLFEHLFATGFETEGVVPAFGVKGIPQHGAAENKKHLAFAHAQLELFDLAWVESIALLNVYFVDTTTQHHCAKKG